MADPPKIDRAARLLVEKDERKRQEAEALRRNLLRRKSQARARKRGSPAPDEDAK